LVNGFETKGEKSIIWDGKNSFGDDVATGVYIYKLQCSDFTDVKKMVLIR
jgi:hypothetical protein